MALHHRLIALAAVVLVVFAQGASASRLAAQPFVIDDTGSARDADNSDRVCATAEGTCTLEAAIDQANSNRVALDAQFKLPGSKPYIAGNYIIPANSIIDGATQPGYGTTPIVGIQQVILENDTKLEHVAVYQAASASGGSGITVAGDGVLIAGSYIGLDPNGSVGADAQKSSIGINVNGHDDVIGGTGEGTRNVIAGWFHAIDVVGSTGTTIEGNYVGVDPDGSKGIADNADISIQASSNVTIGGKTDKARNVISGSQAPREKVTYATGDGVYIDSRSSKVTVSGNYIGTNDEGTAPIPNQGNGIETQSSTEIDLGGLRTGDKCNAPCNLISGNQGNGVTAIGSAPTPTMLVEGNYIGTDITGKKALPNSGSGVYTETPLVIGGGERSAGCDGTCNLISGNGGDGITADGGGPQPGSIEGNFIGVDLTGERELPNDRVGIRTARSGWFVGGGDRPGKCEQQCNLISGNRTGGLVISGDAASKAPYGVQVEGNVIGLDRHGHRRKGLGNGGDGVKVFGRRVTIGSDKGDGNLIADNARDGVELVNAHGVNIWGNRIGVDATGAPAGNKRVGVYVHGSNANAAPADDRVGGTTRTDVRDSCRGACNVISDNSGGVLIVGVSGVHVQGNYIGPDPTGTKRCGAQGYGVKISTTGIADKQVLDTVRNIVGSLLDGMSMGNGANLISANFSGVVIEDDPASGGLSPDIEGNQVIGNLIGTNKNGDEAIPNAIGVLIKYAYGERVGGPDAGNVVSGNLSSGITVKGSSNHVQNNIVGLTLKGAKRLTNHHEEIEIAFGQHNTVTHNTVLAGPESIVVKPAAGTENTTSPNTERPG